MRRGRQLRASEKRGAKAGPTKRGKGTTWMGLVDGAGTPPGAYLDAASPAEVRLLDATLDTVTIERPERVIADLAYESNATRAWLVRPGIEPIIPARAHNRQAKHQDGRRLRRYKRRWIVERTIGWLGNFRRLTVR